MGGKNSSHADSSGQLPNQGNVGAKKKQSARRTRDRRDLIMNSSKVNDGGKLPQQNRHFSQPRNDESGKVSQSRSGGLSQEVLALQQKHS